MGEHFADKHYDWMTIATKVLDSGACMVTVWPTKADDSRTAIHWYLGPRDNWLAAREDMLTVIDACLDTLFHRVGYQEATLF